jgi:hypothetical protein
MLQSFLLKKMLASQLKNVPEAQRDALIAAVERNPDLFVSVAKEVQKRVKAGEDQMAALQAVFASRQDELKATLGDASV